MKKQIIFHILLCLGFFACKNSTSPESPGPIVPLKVGNTWIYEVKRFAKDASLTQTTNDTITIVSNTVLNGVSLYTSNYGATYFYENGGLWTNISGIRHFQVKYPLASGEIAPNDSVLIIPETSPDPIDIAVVVQKVVGENQHISLYHDGNRIGYDVVQFQRDYKGTKKDSVYFSDTRSYQLGLGLVRSEIITPNGTGGNYSAETHELLKVDLK